MSISFSDKLSYEKPLRASDHSQNGPVEAECELCPPTLSWRPRCESPWNAHHAGQFGEPTSDLGLLSALPWEILQDVFAYLDPLSLVSILRVSRIARCLVQDMPGIRDLDLMQPLIEALRKRRTLNLHSFVDLQRAIRAPRCACCGRDIPHPSADNRLSAERLKSPYPKNIFIPTAERGCRTCISRCPRFKVLKLKTARQLFCPPMEGQMRFQLPWSSSSWLMERDPCHWRRHIAYTAGGQPCISLQHAVSSGIQAHGSADAMFSWAEEMAAPQDHKWRKALSIIRTYVGSWQCSLDSDQQSVTDLVDWVLPGSTCVSLILDKEGTRVWSGKT